MRSLIKGDVIRNSENDWILLDVTTNYYLFMMMDTNRMVFKVVAVDDVEADLDNDTTEIVAYKDGSYDTDAFINTPAGNKVDSRNLMIANDLLRKEENLFWLANRNKRASFIKEKAEMYGLTEKTIRQFMRKYLQNNLTIKGLECGYHRCGGRGKERIYVAGRKPGRKGTSLVSLTNSTQEHFAFALRRYKKYKCKRSIKAIYYEMVLEYYSVSQVVNDRDTPFPISEAYIPTIRQLYYYINKRLSKYERYEARHGSRDAWNNKRALLSDTISNLPVKSIGARYEMDAVDIDFEIVDKHDRNKVVGTPTVYFVEDTLSRIVCGYSVGLDTNAWAGAEMALLNMVEDKVEYCAKFGIEISEEDWPVSNVLPSRIQLDNGADFTSFDMENWAIATGTILDYAPTKMASFKPNVERSFGQFYARTKGKLPGEREKDAYGQPHLMSARLTIEEFEEAMVSFIIHYNKTPIEGYPSDLSLFKNKITPAPNKIWNFKLKEGNTGLKTLQDIQDYKIKLLSKDNARITGQGIAYKKMLYLCEDMTWLVAEMQEARFKTKVCEIKYDKRNLNEIYVKVEGRYIRCYLNENKAINQKYDNCSIEEVISINQEVRQREKDDSMLRLTENIQLEKELDDIVRKAKKKHNGPNDIKNIRENRRIEKERIHKEKGVMTESENNPVPTIGVKNEKGRAPTAIMLEKIDRSKLNSIELKQYMDDLEYEINVEKYDK